MKTDNNTSSAHAAPENRVGLTKLDPGAGYVATMNTYTVPPERAEEVLDYLVRSATETVRYVPGFVSMNFHVSLDRTQIVNYGQWKSREAIVAARENPQNRSAHERDREDRGQLQADSIRATPIRGGGRRVTGTDSTNRVPKEKRRKTCQGKTARS